MQRCIADNPHCISVTSLPRFRLPIGTAAASCLGMINDRLFLSPEALLWAAQSKQLKYLACTGAFWEFSILLTQQQLHRKVFLIDPDSALTENDSHPRSSLPMPLEGSTPPISEGWNFIESPAMSPTSNSPSLDDLFEANRLNLTVNPLDMFRPTVRDIDTSTYKPIFPDWEQTLSPVQIDPSVPRDYTVNAFFKSPAEIGLIRAIERGLERGDDSFLSPTATACSLSDWIEADPFDDANAVSTESPIPKQEPNCSPESVFDAEPVLRELNTFDPDFFFEAPSDVVSLDSPLADSLVGNGNVHPSLDSRGTEAFTPLGNPFLDPPPTYHYPQQISSHQQYHFPLVNTPASVHNLVQPELTELDSTQNPVSHCDGTDEDFYDPFQPTWDFAENLGVSISEDDYPGLRGYTDTPLSPGTSAEQSCVQGANDSGRPEGERQEACHLRRSHLLSSLPRLTVPQSAPKTFVPSQPRKHHPPPPPPPRGSRPLAPGLPSYPPVVNPRPILPQHLQSVPLANPWRIGYRNPWFNRPDVSWHQATDPNTGDVVGYCLRQGQAVPLNFAPAAVPHPAVPVQPRPWAPTGRILLAAKPALPSAVRRVAEDEADGHRRKVVIVQGVPYQRVD
ncbi:hypothetical protein G647_06839 [Cladophialophora carrionii CBS 160.54]|uniref:Uncharacterized protein n=1 Tax=Cladophialophora carrionii CBS 160.54 TaxID=1279043 RepID=V9D8W9_9EURO|nr:uncharacterized protein G647_06839 [Cladophialophora carrionii CBS 160.54]ETI22763.1 hypothetical protein G647_06839 [Cladophialophora carrionii CBS 160.54]